MDRGRAPCAASTMTLEPRRFRQYPSHGVPAHEVHASRPAMTKRADLHMWKPVGVSGVTLFRAEHIQQRFTRHSHEEYALGVITGGVLGFDYRGKYHLAGAGEVNLVVPGEAHTGEPALGDEWSYRMFYIQPALMQAVARQAGGDNGALPFFHAGVIQDERLAATVIGLHADLDEQGISALEAQRSEERRVGKEWRSEWRPERW